MYEQIPRAVVATVPGVLQRQCGGIRGWEARTEWKSISLIERLLFEQGGREVGGTGPKEAAGVARASVGPPPFTFRLRLRGGKKKNQRWRNQLGPPVAGQQVPTGFPLAESPSPAASDNRCKPVSDLRGRARLRLD